MTPTDEIEGWSGTKGPYEIATTTLSWRLLAPSDKSGQVCYGDLPAHTWHMAPAEKRADRSMCDARLFAASHDLALFVQKVASINSDDWNAADYPAMLERFRDEACALLAQIKGHPQ